MYIHSIINSWFLERIVSVTKEKISCTLYEILCILDLGNVSHFKEIYLLNLNIWNDQLVTQKFQSIQESKKMLLLL
jgi:hypothetical protein